MENCRIIAENQYRDNNTWVTGLNNNDLIIGPSGAGKTRNYVKPNLMQCNDSMVITDTKGTLYGQIAPLLVENGYEVILIDYKNLKNSYGYNPFDYIRYDEERKCYEEQDILTISATLVPLETTKEPYWDLAARQYLSVIIAYILESRPKKEHNLGSVLSVFTDMRSLSHMERRVNVLKRERPNSYAASLFDAIKGNDTADRTHHCILAVLSEKISTLSLPPMLKLYTTENRLDFKTLEQKKTAVFLTVSDTDRSMDRLVGLLYTQAMNTLCNIADSRPDGRLKVPVRFYLDDFATNTVINNFDNLISVIRSREIYVSIILQSITQLDAIYGDAKAKTIINNCDNCLYLGGQDIQTAEYVAIKCNKPVQDVLEMPLDSAILFTRGSCGQEVRKFDIKSHEKYTQLPEYKSELKKKELKAISDRKAEERAELKEKAATMEPRQTGILAELTVNKPSKKPSFRERRRLAALGSSS